jgi:hypothetical protein
MDWKIAAFGAKNSIDLFKYQQFKIQKMETIFAHNNLQVNFDDIKSTEEYLDGFRKMNNFTNQTISQINGMEEAIIEKRKVLAKKKQELLLLQQEEKEWDSRRGGKIEDQVQETMANAYNESLAHHLLNHSNIFCDNEDRIQRVTVVAPLDIGNLFAIYFDIKKKEISKISIIKEDVAKTEKELTKEEIMKELCDIGDDISREMQKYSTLRDVSKLNRAQMGSVLLEYILKKD